MTNTNPAIFISYSHSDSAYAARGIRDNLVDIWDHSAVFFDTENIDYGERYPEKLFATLATCSVLIAVIGPNWWRRKSSSEPNSPLDWMEIELAYALDTSHGISVIPVLLDDAKLPDKDQLAPGISKILDIHNIRLRNDKYKSDLREIAEAIVNNLRKQHPDLTTPQFEWPVHLITELKKIWTKINIWIFSLFYGLAFVAMVMLIMRWWGNYTP